MRRSLTPTRSCQASHHPTPLFQPGVIPLAPNAPPPATRHIPVAVAYNDESVVETLTDDNGNPVGKRYWAAGTKQVDVSHSVSPPAPSVPNKTGPILGVVKPQQLDAVFRFRPNGTAAQIKERLMTTLPNEPYDFAAEDRRIADHKLNQTVLQPTKPGLIEQYAKSEALRREEAQRRKAAALHPDNNVGYDGAEELFLISMAEVHADAEYDEDEESVRIARSAVPKKERVKAPAAKARGKRTAGGIKSRRS